MSNFDYTEWVRNNLYLVLGIRMHIICLMSSMWKVVDQTKWQSMAEMLSGVCLLLHRAVLHLFL